MVPSEPRIPAMESISSKKTIDGMFSTAVSKRDFSFFSLTPTQRDVNSAHDAVKNVADMSHAVADFPVPGGAYSRIPVDLRVFERLKIAGYFKGITIDSLMSMMASLHP